MGLNYSLTGVFYNKKLAAQIGMTQPPTDARRVREPAREGQGRRAPADHGVGQRQERHGARVPAPEPDGRPSARSARSTTGSSRRRAPRSTRRSNLIAAQHLEQWIKNGYFPPDINAIEYTDAAARFVKGEGVFTFNGDWENAGYDKNMPGNVGFFLMPPAAAGGSPAAMSAPLTYGIAAKAKNADCAAFFLNWVATNDTARQIDVTIGGSNPGGPADATMPAVAAGSVTNETLAAGAVIDKAGNAMDFIANSTSSIFAQGWTPELQKMVGGKQDAAGLLKAVQAEYLRELAQQ